MRISRVVLKCIIIAVGLILPFYQSFSQSISDVPNKLPVKNGVYAVVRYSLSNKDVPLSAQDTLRWHDLIFEDGLGSVGSNDTLFRQRYHRGYFSYSLDSAKHLLGFKKYAELKEYLIEFKYTMPDSNTITLDGSRGKDSLHVELKRTNRHFQLTERQFHLLSEKNR
jgi:hypothetical protein